MHVDKTQKARTIDIMALSSPNLILNNCFELGYVCSSSARRYFFFASVFHLRFVAHFFPSSSFLSICIYSAQINPHRIKLQYTEPSGGQT